MWRQRDANRQLPAEFTTLCALDSREPAAAFVARLPRQLSQRRSWRRSYAMADSNLTPRPLPLLLETKDTGETCSKRCGEFAPYFYVGEVGAVTGRRPR